MNTIDARGLSCPEPVLRVQSALKACAAGVVVTVDNHASVENIKRFSCARGYEVTVQKSASDFILTLSKP